MKTRQLARIHTGTRLARLVQKEVLFEETFESAESGNAFALMTEHRAILAATQGLVYRRLTTSPIIEYGVAWLGENRSPSLANLVAIVDAIAPPLKADLPPDCELLRAGWRHRSTS